MNYNSGLPWRATRGTGRPDVHLIARMGERQREAVSIITHPSMPILTGYDLPGVNNV